ncbi:hypothetical protein D3C71_468530 [compost metagenome]
MRLPDQAVELPEHARAHAQPLQLQAAGFLVQQAQHRALAMAGRQGGHPHVDRPPAHAQRDAAVLRQALFGDVQVRHDLDARDQRGMQGLARRHHIAQGAVHAVAHHGVGFERFDVDIAGAVARGLREQRIDHADDGRVVLRLQQVRHLGHVLQQAVQVDLVFRHAHDGRGVLRMTVGRRQQRLQSLVIDLRERDVAMAAADLAHGPIGRARADGQLRLPPAQRQDRALRASPGIGQGMPAHRSVSGSTATVIMSGRLTRIGDAAGAGGMPGYWRTAKLSTVTGAGRRMVAACSSGRRS